MAYRSVRDGQELDRRAAAVARVGLFPPAPSLRLITDLIAYSKHKGLTDLYLGSVDQMKAAHRFYERNGFERIDPEKLPAHFPRMTLDTVFYHLSLAQ